MNAVLIPACISSTFAYQKTRSRTIETPLVELACCCGEKATTRKGYFVVTFRHENDECLYNFERNNNNNRAAQMTFQHRDFFSTRLSKYV